jgi:hypothetical protein
MSATEPSDPEIIQRGEVEADEPGDTEGQLGDDAFGL